MRKIHSQFMRPEAVRPKRRSRAAQSGTSQAERGFIKTKNEGEKRLFLLFSLGIGLSFLLSPRSVKDAVGKALRLCVGTLLPSLFPFLVLSGIVLRCGLGQMLSSVTGRVFSRLFGIDGSGSAAFLLGIVCGTPTGARVTLDLVENGECTAEEGERLISFCNQTGPAFLIAGVGASMLGSRTAGVCLWLCQTAGAVLTGVLLNRLSCRKRHGTENEKKPDAVTGHPEGTFSASEVFTSSLAAAVQTMPGIFGSVLFFAAVTAALSPVLSVLPPVLRTVFLSLLEITGGIDGAVTASFSRRLTLILCGFASGFGGLSAACQVQTIAAGKVPLRLYLPAKALCGLLTALFAAWIP